MKIVNAFVVLGLKASLLLFGDSGTVVCNAQNVTNEDSEKPIMGVVTSNVIQLPNGQVQYHYTNATSRHAESCCDSVVMINVGTGMSVQDYERLAEQIVREDRHSSTVIAIMDNNPGSLAKYDAGKFTNVANDVAEQLTTFAGPCCEVAPKNGYLLGGHSAGGQAAADALTLTAHDVGGLEFRVAGFLGLAPYEVDRMLTDIRVPSLTWDFSQGSCFVDPDRAGLAAYASSDPTQRVFYQVETFNVGTGGLHCTFADRACAWFMCGGNGATREWIHRAVGESVYRFFAALEPSGDAAFTAENMYLDVPHQLDINLFVNDDSESTVIKARECEEAEDSDGDTGGCHGGWKKSLLRDVRQYSARI